MLMGILLVAALVVPATYGAAAKKTMTIMLPWGVPGAGQPDPMGDAFRAWKASYEAKHKDIEVKILEMAWDDHWTWIRAHAAAGDLPDVLCQRVDNGHGFIVPTPEQEAEGKSIFLALDDYMKLKNPYTGIPLSKEYTAANLGAARYNLKHLYFLPISQGMSALIYNADAFAKAGIKAKATMTVTDFLAALQKLRNAGYKNPIGGPGVATDGNIVTLFAGWLAGSAFKTWAAQYAGSDPLQADYKTFYQAVLDGKLSYKDERLKKLWEICKQIAGYYDPGSYSRDYNLVWDPFNKGDYVIMPEWSGRFIRAQQAIQEKTATFKAVGGMNFPIMDKAAMAASDAVRNGPLSTWGCTWSIAASAVKRGTANAAKDFLWWWASGKENNISWNQAKPASANGDAPPTITALNKWAYKDTVPFLFENMAPSYGGLILWSNDQLQRQIYQYALAFFQGQIGYDEFAANADQLNASFCKTALDQLK